VTVTAVAPSSTGVQDAAATQIITISSPTVNAHYEGCAIAPTAVGLSIQPGTDTYLLPRDFIDIDKESFDLAVGAKSTQRRGNSFFDSSYIIAQQLSGVGYGGASNYGPSFPSGYPIAGNPFDNPNSGVASRGTSETIFRFLRQGQPQLVITPVPQGATVTLDFFYRGSHTIASIPDADIDAVLHYAAYVLYQGQAAALNQGGDLKIGDREQFYSKNAAQLNALAKCALEEFERRVRLVPYGVSG
jgi:hypothetical protein